MYFVIILYLSHYSDVCNIMLHWTALLVDCTKFGILQKKKPQKNLLGHETTDASAL